MDLIIGVAIGAIAIALVVMFSLAQSAKETDELENKLFAQKVEKIKAKRHDNSRNE